MQSTPSEPAPSDSSIIRAGSDGRLRFTPAQRQELLDAFDRSGLSAMAFARAWVWVNTWDVLQEMCWNKSGQGRFNPIR